LRKGHTYIIINASYEGICADFERKRNIALVFLHSNCVICVKIFYDLPFKYYFWQCWYMLTKLSRSLKVNSMIKLETCYFYKSTTSTVTSNSS